MNLTEKMLQLYELGYEPIPISGKVPVLEGWSKMEINPEVIETFELLCSFGSIGARTGEVVGLDLDILDLKVVKQLMKWIEGEIGGFRFRVGRSPKVLIPVFLKGGCKKRRIVLQDDAGAEHAVEVLGVGQQFVVDGIHPGTQEPYKWFRGGLFGVAAGGLPEVSLEFLDDLFEKFIEISGWDLVKRGAGMGCTGNLDLGAYRGPLGLTGEEVERLVCGIVDDDYDTWYQVGLAIKKEFPGVEGLELFDLYSQQGNYGGAEVIEKFWDSFKPVAITGKALYKFAGEEVPVEYQGRAAEVADPDTEGPDEGTGVPSLEALKMRLDACSDLQALTDVCRGELSKEPEKWQFVGLIGDRAKELCGERPPKTRIKAWLNPSTGSGDGEKKVPKWARRWCYLTHQDRMFHTLDKRMITTTAFDMLSAEGFGAAKGAARELRTEGLIPVYHNAIYHPGQGKVFDYQGVACVNMTKAWPIETGESDGSVFEAHAEKQFGAEGVWLLDYLAYCYQNPGKKIRWGLLLQGVEGDGKTFWKELMAVAIGQENVKDVTVSEIGSEYSDWVFGSAFSVMEEVRLSGSNRVSMMDKLKAALSNSTIQVLPKGLRSHQIPNVTNYLLLTNHKDALPLDENNRRYDVLYSNYQTKGALEGPEYYKELFGALKDVDNVRRFLGSRDTLAIDPNVKPGLSGTDIMKEESKTDDQLIIEDVVEVLGNEFSNAALKVSMEEQGIEYNNKATPGILRRLGFHRFRAKDKGRGRGWRKGWC